MAGRGNQKDTSEEMASSDRLRSIFQAWQLRSSNPKMAHALHRRDAEAGRRRRRLTPRAAARLVRPSSPPIAVAAAGGRAA